MTQEARIYHREKKASSISSAGKTGQFWGWDLGHGRKAQERVDICMCLVAQYMYSRFM